MLGFSECLITYKSDVTCKNRKALSGSLWLRKQRLSLLALYVCICVCESKHCVCVFRGSLEGKREQKSYKAVLEDPMLKFSGLYQETCSDLYVTCQVFAEGKPLALPVRTSYKAFSTRWK